MVMSSSERPARIASSPTSLIDIARKGEGCVLQRQRASRYDSIGVGKGGCAGNGQHIRQFGIDAVGKIRILAQREVGLFQRQGVGVGS